MAPKATYYRFPSPVNRLKYPVEGSDHHHCGMHSSRPTPLGPRAMIGVINEKRCERQRRGWIFSPFRRKISLRFFRSGFMLLLQITTD
ncbi:hypothetical protein TNIN_251471 [Trichonephila inaurata madagascariensis]|uniref:Uncharacterized protein n=1 Tax=Trichonephila inaurata madagascariensis TaxID=2747483 RepID=A0A8X7C7M9_9ARAC|nr:hypothetical protein TNIN_251471 [Trichonephila inaurata madagascariensis]